MHLVSLEQAAGVESHFTEFVIQARAARPDWTHGWLNPSRRLHPYFAARLREALAQRIDAKYWHGMKIPVAAADVRAAVRALRRARTDSLVIWNRSAKLRYALDAAGDERCIHWEHGAAWDAGREARAAQVLSPRAARDRELARVGARARAALGLSRRAARLPQRAAAEPRAELARAQAFPARPHPARRRGAALSGQRRRARAARRAAARRGRGSTSSSGSRAPGRSASGSRVLRRRSGSRARARSSAPCATCRRSTATSTASCIRRSPRRSASSRSRRPRSAAR